MTSPQTPESPAFAALARFVVRFRWPLLAACFVASGSAVHTIHQSLVIDSRTEAFLSAESDAIKVLREMRDDFGSDVYLQVVVQGDVFSRPFLERLRELHDEVGEIDVELDAPDADDAPRPDADADADADPAQAAGAAQPADSADDEWGEFEDDEGWGDETGGSVVEDVVSLINARQTHWVDDGLRVDGLLDTLPPAAEMTALKKRVLGDRSLIGRVVGRDGKTAVIVIRTRPLSEREGGRAYDAVYEVAARFSREGFVTQVAGMPALNAAVNRTMVGDMQRLFGIGLLASLVLLGVLFRHPLGVLGPVLVVAQAFAWTSGSMAALDTPVTIITNILPAFVIAVGLGDSVHIQSVYRDLRRDGVSNEQAVVRAVAGTGMPVLFTTVTTGVGLLSFQFAKLQAIRDLGLFGAIGVVSALVLSLVIVPIMLSFNKKSLLGAPPQEHGDDWLERLLGFCDRLSRPAAGASPFRARNRTLMAALVISLASAAAALLVDVYHDPLTWVPAGVPGREAIVTLNDEVGGVANVAIVVKPVAGSNIKRAELLRGLEAFEKHLVAYEDPSRPGVRIVENPSSVLEIIRETWRAVHEGDASRYALPDSQRGFDDMFSIFGSASPDELRKLVTVDYSRTLMMVRVRWLDALSYAPLMEHIERGIAEHLAGHATVDVTGGVVNMVSIVEELLWDLLRSFGVAFLVIATLMVLLLRDLKLGLIAMVPNLMPIVVIMGIMGLTGIPLDVSTLIIASVAIGIAVDDTIHFLHQYRASYLLHRDVEVAIAHAFRHTGRAMVATSVILVCGFGVYLSASMINVQRFGMLVGLTVVLALFIDLIFAPALLRALYRPRADS